MLEHRLFGSAQIWRRRRRLRPMVLAVFSYRYDAQLVPDLLANIEPMVDGWVAFDDRGASTLFSDEPRRRRLLIERAKELGATWVLAIDPDERIERGGATRVRGLTCERRRIVWEFNLREMFTGSTYRVDGTWGAKMQGRLFPIFDGPLCSKLRSTGRFVGVGPQITRVTPHSRRVRQPLVPIRPAPRDGRPPQAAFARDVGAPKDKLHQFKVGSPAGSRSTARTTASRPCSAIKAPTSLRNGLVACSASASDMWTMRRKSV